MVKVIITGGSGFVASHLIKRLQENASDIVSEIHTIDRRSKSSQNFDHQEKRIPVIHHCCDLLNRESIEPIFNNADVVFHLARKQFQYLVSNDKQKLNEQYRKDNVEAVESLINAMINKNVQNLVYIGDAYANLPCQDNFGNSEEIHHDVPSSFMLGYYGECRTKGELLARNKVGAKLANGKPLQGTFLRPTLIYGEGETKIATIVRQVAKTHNGCLPYIEGPSNGLVQYIHASNLASIMEENMRLLLKSPEKCNAEFLYCMDKTECSKFSDFAKPILNCFNMKLDKSSSLLWNYTRLTWNEFISSKPNINEFTWIAFRFLFLYAAGFSNRKQQLIFDFRCESQPQLFERTIDWVEANMTEKSSQKQRSAKNILRMG